MSPHRDPQTLAAESLSAVAPLLQQKDVKALAVTSAKRSFALPNVPSIGETVPRAG